MIHVRIIWKSQLVSKVLASIFLAIGSIGATASCQGTTMKTTQGDTMATSESTKSLSQTKDYPDKADIGAASALVMSYLDTINKSDLEGMVSFYAPDAVYMPEYSDPVVGTAAIRNSYRALFEAFTIKATITVDEVVQVASEWMFARCHSSGIMTVNHTGQPGPVVANQELFIFQKINGSWKIARYSFSSRKPPRVAAK